jgi:hypothetical protein
MLKNGRDERRTARSTFYEIAFVYNRSCVIRLPTTPRPTRDSLHFDLTVRTPISNLRSLVGAIDRLTPAHSITPAQQYVCALCLSPKQSLSATSSHLAVRLSVKPSRGATRSTFSALGGRVCVDLQEGRVEAGPVQLDRGLSRTVSRAVLDHVATSRVLARDGSDQL